MFIEEFFVWWKLLNWKQTLMLVHDASLFLLITGSYKVPSKCNGASPNIAAIYSLIEGLDSKLS